VSLLQNGSALGEGTVLSRRKKTLFTVTYVLVEVLLCICLAELALRFLPLGKYRSAPFRQYDPEIGISLIPNKHLIHSRGCFQGEVYINGWGMRDRDRTLEKPVGAFRIAVIGDSYVEAVQVKPDEVVNIRMEKVLRERGYNNAQVMSFGVEGIGTTQELLLYKEKVRPFRPDLVILMFTDNDVFNNSSTLQPKVYGIHDWYSPYFDLGPDGKLVFKPVEPQRFSKLRSYLESHSVLLYYLERIWYSMDIPLYKWDGLPLFYKTYSDDPLDDE
jgi:lysophospholipase L1-like esterase